MSTLRDAIKEAIVHELRERDGRGTVICLTGAWGCGKTHLWKEIAAELAADRERIVGYVSLFGIASITDARTAVFNSLVIDHFSKDGGDAKKFAARAGGWLVQRLPSAFAGVINSKVGAEILTRNIDTSRLIPEGAILCLDDLERISPTFPVHDALGYANHLAEQRQSRVLVIMNEEHLDPRFGTDVGSLIRAYRERVVRTFLKLETTLSDALPHLARPASVTEVSAKVAVETLERAGCTNLRTLIRALETIGRAQSVAQVELEVEEVRFLTALIAEHAAGRLQEDAVYYDFHPIIFEVDKRSKEPERNADKKAFYKSYFDGVSYRSDHHLHGLVRNGYLNTKPYLDARNERLRPPPTRLGKLVQRIARREYFTLSDDEAVSWLAETASVLTADESELSGAQVSTLYTVASIVAECAAVELASDLVNTTENALLSSARRGDVSLADRFGAAVDTRLSPQLISAYREEVTRAQLATFRTQALDAVLARDIDRCRTVVRAGLPDAVERFLEDPLLQEVHATLSKDRRFYFELLTMVAYVVDEYQAQGARERLAAYARAALDGSVGGFLGGQVAYPPLDNVARFRLRSLLRELGADPDARPAQADASGGALAPLSSGEPTIAT